MLHINDADISEGYPIIISLYYHHDDTGNKGYEKHAKALRDRCEDLQLPYDIVDVTEDVRQFSQNELSPKNLTDTHKRVHSFRNRYIPFFIRNMLGCYAHPLLFMHCDSWIDRWPAATIFDGLDVGYSIGAGKGGRRHLLSNPIYIRPTKIAWDFLDVWAYKCKTVDIACHAEHKFLGTTTKDYNRCDSVDEFPVQMSSRDKDDNPYILF